MDAQRKPRLSVHKFSSCDGCQLSVLNLGEALLDIVDLLDIQHFAEAGILNELAQVDIALVEGSISTPVDIERIQAIRNVSHFLVTIGACATAGGLQALRNFNDANDWVSQIYANPEYISSLDKVSAVRDYVHVDWEIWGCPVNQTQVLEVIIALSQGRLPIDDRSKLCLECKQKHRVCVVVTKSEPCLGPVTRSGCGALCPSVGRGCYGCYGPAENINSDALLSYSEWLAIGARQDIVDNYRGIYSQIKPFNRYGNMDDGEA